MSSDAVLIRARRADHQPRVYGTNVVVTDYMGDTHTIHMPEGTVVPVGARVHPALSSAIEACVAANNLAAERGHELPGYVLDALRQLTRTAS